MQEIRGQTFFKTSEYEGTNQHLLIKLYVEMDLHSTANDHLSL